MFIATLSFISGILVVQQFPLLPETFWIFTVFLLTVSFALLRYWRLMFFTIGLLWALSFASFRLADRLIENLQGQLIEVEGQVIGLPKYDERRVRFDFSVSKPEIDFPNKIRLSWFFPKQRIAAGQNWRFTVKLKKPRGRLNSAGFDYERWLFVQNISATGYVRAIPIPQLIKRSDSSWFNLDTIRQAIADKILILAAQTENLGVIKALTIGERSSITKKQWDIFRETGTVHLLAISGLHIGLIAGLAYLLMLKTGVSLAAVSPQALAAIFSIIVALFYASLAGFSLPTQRALLMLTIAMFAIFWQRNSTPVNTLTLTLLIVLIVDPLAVLSAGFWLSFSAVILILYSLAGRLGKVLYWESSIKIHFVMAIGLAPILAHYFQQISIISPFANLVTVPIISLVVVPLCLLAVLLMFYLPLFAELLFLLVDYILRALGVLLSTMTELPYASVSTGSVPFYGVLLALLGVFVLLSPRGVPARWLGIVLLLPLFFVEIKKPALGEVLMTLLDVGQGLSVVIETNKHVLVFDAGAKYSKQYNMGDAVVIPFLKSKGINKVDTLLISHGDNDHRGGTEAIITQMQVDEILTSVPKELPQYKPSTCLAGQSWVWDQVKFEILSPGINSFLSENNNSCVLKISTKHGRLLLTGDIEVEAEEWLVNSYQGQLKSNVLVAPHHGSKTSSSLAFLKQVKPTIVLIPSGYRNRFSFPHTEVLQRYKSINSTWINTADAGAITIELHNDSITAKSERIENGKYWNK